MHLPQILAPSIPSSSTYHPYQMSSSDEYDSEGLSIHADETASTSTTSRTFHLFPRLPTEIRLMIWEFSIVKRTIIANYEGERFQLAGKDITDPLPHSLRNTTPLIPPILHVNREAREVGLKYYELAYWVTYAPKERDWKRGCWRKGRRERLYYFHYGLDEIHSPRPPLSSGCGLRYISAEEQVSDEVNAGRRCND